MNQREREALDRHITGNYGEDQLREQPGMCIWDDCDKDAIYWEISQNGAYTRMQTSQRHPQGAPMILPMLKCRQCGSDGCGPIACRLTGIKNAAPQELQATDSPRSRGDLPAVAAPIRLSSECYDDDGACLDFSI